METELVKCWICKKPATGECDYCGKPTCGLDSCHKLVMGQDPGKACAMCYAVLMVKGVEQPIVIIPPKGEQRAHNN